MGSASSAKFHLRSRNSVGRDSVRLTGHSASLDFNGSRSAKRSMVVGKAKRKHRGGTGGVDQVFLSARSSLTSYMT
eukprot:scaffold108668_cov26-Tisochrysis_lutea.AAC.2